VSDEPGIRRVAAQVFGRVQGVYYRASTQARARELGLRGWVRNRSDGSVELCAEGPAVALEQLVAWLEQGPPAARVDRVETDWHEATGEPASFEIRR